jgi:hypothetical protein
MVNPKYMDQKKRLHRSMAIKLHDPYAPGNMELARKCDVVITSHRAVEDMLISNKLAFNKDVSCPGLMDKQKHVYAVAKEYCGGVAYDMDHALLQTNVGRALTELGRSLGVCKEAMTSGLVEYVVDVFQYMDGEDLQAPGQHWHTDEERDVLRAEVREAIARNEDCQAWAERKGTYADAGEAECNATNFKKLHLPAASRDAGQL